MKNNNNDYNNLVEKIHFDLNFYLIWYILVGLLVNLFVIIIPIKLPDFISVESINQGVSWTIMILLLLKFSYRNFKN